MTVRFPLRLLLLFTFSIKILIVNKEVKWVMTNLSRIRINNENSLWLISCGPLSFVLSLIFTLLVQSSYIIVNYLIKRKNLDPRSMGPKFGPFKLDLGFSTLEPPKQTRAWAKLSSQSKLKYIINNFILSYK